MKNLVILLALLLSSCVSTVADVESGGKVDIQTHEEYLAIPDIVYENIVVLLDDGYSEYDVVEYYNTHRAWADSLTLEDKLSSW